MHFIQEIFDKLQQVILQSKEIGVPRLKEPG
jgi:hypothetical protein